MRNFDYYRPKTRAEAEEVLAKRQDARPKGGGTDLLPLMKDRLTDPEAVLELSRVAELGGIGRGEDGRLRIGASATLAEVGASELLRTHAPAVAEAGGSAATPLLRTRATVGGNLCQRPRCWYFRNPDYDCAKKGGDVCFAQNGENKYHAVFDNSPCAIVHPSNLAPALIAHDALIHVSGASGERSVPAGAFWINDPSRLDRETVLAPGEIVTAVTLEPSKGSAYLEVKEKQSFDWALASAACRLEMDGDIVRAARIVVSHVAPTPLRQEAAERVLTNESFSPERAGEAAEVVVRTARPLRDNAYKVRLTRAVVAHALEDAARKAQEGGR